VFVNSLSSTLAQSLRNENVTGYKIPRIHYPQVNEAVRQRLLRVAVAASSIERVYSSYTDTWSNKLELKANFVSEATA
jgi:hypothetical protein